MGLVDPMRSTADLDGEGLSYGVERRSRDKEESKFAEIAKVTESTYTDSDVSSGNTYLYRVFAKNEFGTGIGSNVVPVRYIKIEAPTGPTKLTAEAIESFALKAAELLKDAFYHGFNTCFPNAPDRDLVEVGVGKTWGDASSEQAIVSLDEATLCRVARKSSVHPSILWALSRNPS
ncbi:hypothetical protein N8Z64_05890 [Pseudomonadales bacterium]|nr:hypothetical protein [Pseudomonadales bacterium]